MNRIIKDIKSVGPELMELIHAKCPEGRIRKKDLLDFPIGNGKHLKVIEIKTDDSIYLIKVNDGLHAKMEEMMLEVEDANDVKRSRDDMLDDLSKMNQDDDIDEAEVDLEMADEFDDEFQAS